MKSWIYFKILCFSYEITKCW